MGIAIILFNLRCFRLKYSTAAAGIIVLFFCSSLWGYIPNLQEKRLPVSFPSTCKGPIAEDQLIRSDSGGFAKRGSNNQLFQQWQDLSPAEQEKMRKKYKEWQSLPPEEQQLIRRRMNQLNKMPSQQRKLYKQLFRQWQHLSPKERKQIQNDLNNWENLSPQQRKAIRRRFKN
jgi:mRNA-degrading endonuclease RelE of RelBE toxin-antitoxin system